MKGNRKQMLWNTCDLTFLIIATYIISISFDGRIRSLTVYCFKNPRAVFCYQFSIGKARNTLQLYRKDWKTANKIKWILAIKRPYLAASNWTFQFVCRPCFILSFAVHLQFAQVAQLFHLGSSSFLRRYKDFQVL